MAYDADAIIIGAGLAGLVAAAELIDARKTVIILDQEPEQSLGGQAFWSLGGLFLVDSPEQRRMGIRDSHALALQDWMGTAAFDREEDHWPRRWAEAYVAFAAGEKRSWLHARGIRFFPVVGWAERGGYDATGHGNSVPRFHVAWGTGPGVLAPFVERVREAAQRGLVRLKFRHRVSALTRSAGAIDGVCGEVLEPSNVERGRKSSRALEATFALKAQAVIVASGGSAQTTGWSGSHGRSRLASRLAMISGVPDHVEERCSPSPRTWAHASSTATACGATPGGANWNPLWTEHAIRIIPGPSALWIDARSACRCHCSPSTRSGRFDTLIETGHDHSWFVWPRSHRARVALSGSEQNPDLTSKSMRQVYDDRISKGAPAPVGVQAPRSSTPSSSTTWRSLVQANEHPGRRRA